MERILTNLQLEWLSNIKLLSDYEDDSFSKEDMSDKFASFVENEYQGDVIPIVYELQVLREKEFIILEEGIFDTYVTVKYVNITKKGSDYLVMLKEDFAEKLALNEKLVEIISQINKVEKILSNKDVLNYTEQITSILSNVISLIPSVGNFCQGAIAIATRLIKLKPIK